MPQSETVAPVWKFGKPERAYTLHGGDSVTGFDCDLMVLATAAYSRGRKHLGRRLLHAELNFERFVVLTRSSFDAGTRRRKIRIQSFLARA